MPYVIFYYIICYMFSEATTTVLESFTNSTGKHLCWSQLFKKLQTCRPISCLFFSIPIVHVNYVKCYCLHKHFYGFLEIDLRKLWKKTHIKHIHICGSQTFWSFMKFYFVHILTFCEGLFFVFEKQSLCLHSYVYA